LGNAQAPTKNDRKLAIEIKGQAAKEIFDSIYPDAKVTCSSEKGERLRSKRDLWCAYMPSQGYRCFLSFNLVKVFPVGAADVFVRSCAQPAIYPLNSR